MYNVINPAVAKSIMLRMNKEQLNTEIAFFEQELKNLQEGNFRNMILRLNEFAENRLKQLIN